VRIGGDARHFRYLAFPFCLSACAFTGIPEQLWITYARGRHAWALPVAGAGLALVVLAAYPPQLSAHPILASGQHEEIRGINDAELHRRFMALHHADWNRVTPRRLKAYRDAAGGFQYAGIVSEPICVESYVRFDQRTIHAYGLTDGVLARAKVETSRPGHKPELILLARELAALQQGSEPIGRGMYAAAVDSGRAPYWVRDNLETIQLLERKIYNRHDVVENLQLAFSFPGQLEIRDRKVVRFLGRRAANREEGSAQGADRSVEETAERPGVEGIDADPASDPAQRGGGNVRSEP
jgi:hypothetical protein